MKTHLPLWLTLSLFSLFCSSLNSQITFQKTFGSGGDDVANWVAVTSTGYIVAGYTTTPGAGRDGYLLNLDFMGNTIWQKKIGGLGVDRFNVVYETNGGFYVLGETDSYGAGADDVWLLKLSPAGTILWSKTIGDAGTSDLANSMIPVSGNRILISGAQTPAGSTGFNSCFYLVDSNGQLVWSRTYRSNDIGNLMRSNYVDNGVIYAGGGIETEGGFLRMDLETGNQISAVQYPGNSTEALYYLQPAADGNLLLCDHTWSATNGAQVKQWVNKITPAGQTIWSKVYSLPLLNLRGRIEQAGNDQFLLTPYDNALSSNSDAILAKIDADGNLMWSRNYGRPGLDWLWKSQLAPDGGFISVGSTTAANGNRDVLIIKTDHEGLVAGCCIPDAGIITENYTHIDVDFSFSPEVWASPVAASNQQVNANLQVQDYCANTPVEIFQDIALCPNDVFTFQGVDYYAPDDVIEVLPGLFGCDTTIHYSLLLLPSVSLTEYRTFCPGESVTIHGQNYYGPDTVVVNLSNASGCDTMITYYLAFDTIPGNCQSCKGTFLKIVGDAGQDVRGHGVYDAGDGNLYVTGTKQDSVLLLKITPSGSIIWSRTLDILPGIVDNVAEIIVDAEGMIAGCGQSGDEQPIEAGFVFRYDPGAGVMLWTQLITTGSPYVMGIMEITPGGNYLLNSNPHQPENNAQLTEISRATGAIVPGVLTKMFDLGSADNFNSTMIFNGKLIGVGRFTAGNQFTDMRHTIARIDVPTGQLEETYVEHLWVGPPARLYGMDFVLTPNAIVSVGYGDDTGDDLNNSRIFLYHTSNTPGFAGPPFRIDLQAVTGDAVDEIVRVPDGYILLCHSLFQSPEDLFLVKLNELTQVVWSKKVDYGHEQLLPVSIVQSQILAKDGFLFCVATTTNTSGEKRMMILKISQDGKMDGACDYVSDTEVTAELITMTTAQNVFPVEDPVADVFTALQVAVSDNIPESEFFCRELVEDLVQIPLCPGASITIDGQTYVAPDTVVVNYTNTLGCDSIITYVMTLLPQPVRSESITFCPGESVVIGGQSYTQSGTVIDTLPGIAGCDTIVTYTLTLLPLPTEVFNDIGLCPNEAFTYQGIDYYAPGEIVDTLSSVSGCDSIIHYGLLLLPQPTLNSAISFCPGESILINGQLYTQSGTVLDTIPGIGGCDTLVTYSLTLLSQPTRAETIFFCPGESVVIGGQTYTQAGIVTDTLSATTGCDTIVTYTLESLLPSPSVVTIHCPNDISLIAEPGMAPMLVNYNLPTTASDCPCPGVSLTLTAGLPPGGAFPNGMTQVCYTARDSCGQSASCCFNVTIREIQPCDVKVNGCIRYELLSITADPFQNLTYRIRVVNNCANKLIYTAIQLPDGEIAMEPDHLSIFTSEGGRNYEVRNPNFTPFYSIRFKSTTDSISGGQSDIFQYTLPAQLAPAYMDITSRLAPQVFYEAHLNTFYCPIGITPENRAASPVKEQNGWKLYPNPTDGTLWIDLSNRVDTTLQWRIFNTQGQVLLHSTEPVKGGVLHLELGQVIPGGLYFFEVLREDGQRETLRFVLQH